MSLTEALKRIKEHHQKLKIPGVPQTSVVSPLFPGQFNYCLDEVHLYNKYGDFIHIPEEEHFQKIQPAIRLADFEKYFLKIAYKTFHEGESHEPESSRYHLASFSISTINGGHVLDREKGSEYYRKSVGGLLEFFNSVGLHKDRVYVSYFSGGATSKEVERSRKRYGQQLKVETEYRIDEDILSKNIWLEAGLKKEQLICNKTRDNFLTTNWDVTRAPWGYRNEIFYRLSNGDLLDIATIERLILEPIIEKRDGINYVVDLKPWNRCFLIDACGLERLELAVLDLSDIFELPEFKTMTKEGFSPLHIESARILHRVFTDSTWEQITSRRRRQKLNIVTRCLNDLSLDKLKRLLSIHGAVYGDIFPELSDGVELTLKEIKNYRGNKRNLHEQLRLKKKEMIKHKKGTSE